MIPTLAGVYTVSPFERRHDLIGRDFFVFGGSRLLRLCQARNCTENTESL